MDYYLSVDYGGTNTKAIIFDGGGKQLAVSSFQTLRIEEKLGYREVDLDETWTAIAASIKEVIEQSGVSPKSIRGVSCIGHGKGLYLLDKEGNVFTRGILSTDSRAVGLAAEFEERVSEIWKKTRQHIVGVQNPVLLRWLKDHEPNIYKEIGSVLSAKDFVRFKLTNRINQEYGDASGNHWINFETGDYDTEILEFFGIADIRAALPPLVDYKDIVGGVTKEASLATGLAEGTPVIGGLFDIDACALGSGVLASDVISVIAGTWNINTYVSSQPAAQESGLMNSYFPTKEFLVEASSPTSAGNLDILLKTLMSEEIKQAGGNIYPVLEEFLANTDQYFSKVIFLPFLYGTNSHPQAKASFLGLSSITTKSEMIRAVYEGVVFAHRQHIDQLVASMKTPPRVVRLSGGGSQSASWCQMFADILGLPVEIVDGDELGGLGGAISIAQAVQGGDLDDVVQRMVRVKARFEPSTVAYDFYTKKYEAYLQILSSLEQAWPLLKELERPILD